MRKENYKNMAVSQYIDYFINLWKGEKPIAKQFKTSANGYIYDTGTSKILKCKPHVFSLLECFLSFDVEEATNEFIIKHSEEQYIDAANIIKSAIENEGVLLSIGASHFGLGDHYGDLKALYDSKLTILQLEVTERCQLRCRYCLYNNTYQSARNHGNRDMSLSIAYKAIDYFKKHSYKSDMRAVTFYGGEPLLRFDFVKSCIIYAKSVFLGTTVEFSITTNGALITPEIANFFLENNVNVVVSIDGPKDIHDSYRKDIHGNGSFDKAAAGLKILVDAYEVKAESKISLSMVYAPPYSEARIQRIASMWDELPWLSKNIDVNITYPAEGTITPEIFKEVDLIEDKNLGEWANDNFEKKYMGLDAGHSISNSIVEKKLAILMQRSIFHEPFDKYYLNGCCVPGLRKIFTTVDGTFRVCEKLTSEAPNIGNVFTGLDLETIKNTYINEYEKISLPNCSKCWGIRLCDLCYIRAFEAGNLDAHKKSKFCHGQLNLKQRLIEFLCYLLELNPKGLNYMYDFQLS
jgi:uncharacterized protein